MSNKTIYDALRTAGLTAEGACGLMGNMMAESTMKANIAQRGMTSMSDETYTAAADNGTIDFARDAVGYGLCQWTFHTRKAALLAYAKNMGVSVGDEAMQVQFCIRELTQDYPMLMLTLKTSHDIDACSDRVCDKYERPAVNNYDARRSFARQFWNDFCGSGALAEEHAKLEPEPTQDAAVHTPANADAGVKAAVMVMQMVMNCSGYWGIVTGERSPEFFAALRTFTDDLEKQ